MEVFAYHPDGAESLEGFNKRVEDFCRENPVSDVAVSQLGQALIMSMILLSDFPASPFLLLPILKAINPLAAVNLEALLTEEISEIEGRSKGAAGAAEVKQKVLRVNCYGIHGRDEGYAVLFAIIGMAEGD